MSNVLDTTTLATIQNKVSHLNEHEKKNLLAQLRAKLAGGTTYSSNSLSHAQLRLWLLDELSSCPFLYHIPLILKLNEGIDYAQLESAVHLLIQRVPLLKSYFFLKEEEIQQEQGDVTIQLEVIEVQQELPVLFDVANEPLVAEFFLTAFNKTKAPLFRFAILKTPHCSYLIACFHHLILDGWSVPLLVEQLNECYRTINDAPLENTYQDYIVWEQKQEICAQDKEYWVDNLRGCSFIVDLVNDYLRPIVTTPTVALRADGGSDGTMGGSNSTHEPLRPINKTYQGKTHLHTVNNTTFLALNELAKSEGVSLNHLVLFTFQLLLARYSGQDDITLGIPVSGRPHQRWYKTIGLFVNTCLHSVTMDYTQSVATHLKEVKNQFLKDMAHANIPFDEVVKALYQEQQINPNQAFNVLYNFIQMQPEQKAELITIAEQYCALPISKFDLSLHVYASSERLDLLIEYSTELFADPTMQHIIHYFVLLLKTIPAYGQASLKDWLWDLASQVSMEQNHES